MSIVSVYQKEKQFNVKFDQKNSNGAWGIELYFEWKDLKGIKSNNAITSFRALIKEV